MLNIGTWILKKLAPEFLKKAWGHFNNKRQDSKNASHDYVKPYKNRHGRLQVSCIGMNASKALDDIYVVVQFLGKRRSTKHTSPEAVEEAFRKSGRTGSPSTSDERQDGMRVANDEQYLMVLGGPGVGKSTFLRKVGFEALKKENGNFESECTPVLLELKRFTEEPVDIEAWIADEFKICGYPYPERMKDKALKSGEILVLFDGLDEVPTVKAKNIINKIRDFVHQYSENRFIVSCREGAYSGGFIDFATVEMADFDDSQIQDYINNWFASASNRKTKTGQRCWETLNASDHKAIKTLAQNPLSLALLCTIYEDSQEFPSRQVILYEKIFNIFLKKWTAEKGVRRASPMSPYLDILTVKELLSEIAVENFKADRLVFSEDELTNQIQEFYQRRTDVSSRFDASEILDAILVDPGLFVERANGIYSFFHLTFQEYLTANHIAGDTPLIEDLVSNHLHDDRYREIFLFVAGLMREVDDLLEAMEAEAFKLVNTDGIKSLLQWVKQKTNTKDDRYKGIVKQLFMLRQFFALWLLNKIYEVFENVVNHDLDRYLNLDRYLDLDFVRVLDRHLDRNFDRYLDRNLCGYLAFDQHLDRNLTEDSVRNFDRYFVEDLVLRLYQDFYKYMDTDFYRSVSSRSRNQFDKKLQKQITFVTGMEDMKIFKQVDLQRMVQRFNEQREFIKAAAEGKSVEPPAESIHDTWLSVLGITDEMLAIPREALESYVTYLKAVELTVACKEAVGGVSPEVWNGIEERFLTSEAAEIKA